MTCTTPSGVKWRSSACEICVTAKTNTRSKNSSTLVTRLCWCGTITRNIAPRGLSAPSSPPSRRQVSATSGYPGLQRQRVQHAAHLALQRLIDDLVLLHAGLAAEGLRDHGRGIVVAVAGEVTDRHLGIGDRCLDHRLDIVGVHWHSGLAPVSALNSLGLESLPGPRTGRPNLA